MKAVRRARTRPGVLPPRASAVSRADLAWLLYVLPAGEAQGCAALLGFAREEEVVVQPTSPVPTAPRPLQPREEQAARRPLRAVHFAVIELQRVPAEGAEDASRADESTKEQADDVFATLQPEPGAVVPAALALSPPARLASFLRRTLRTPGRGREVDVDRLLARLARVSLPRRLPLRRWLHWSDEAALIVDLSPAVWPLREDLIDLAWQAARVSAGRLPVYARPPGSGWLCRRAGRRGEWVPVDEAVLSSAHHWLLAGDPGHASADCAAGREWQNRCRRHLATGGTLTVLCAGSPSEWLRRLPRRGRCVGWDYGRPLRARRPGAAAAGSGAEAGSERLLAALSLAVVVEPPLLRAIRVALGLPLADELAAWNHADSEACVLGMQLRQDRLSAHRGRLAGEPLADRQRVAALIAGHHVGHYRAIRSEEAALAVDLAGVDADEARGDWARAVRTLQRAPQSEAACELAAYLGRAGGRAHESLWQALPALADAYVIARRAELRAGEAVPPGLPGRSLERLLALPEETAVRRRWSLRLCGPALIAGVGAPQVGEFVLAEGEAVTGVAVEAARAARFWQSLPASDADRVRLAALRSGGGPWVVASARERIVVAEVPRPSWALAWGRDRQGLFAVAPSLAGEPLRLYWSADGEAPAVWPPPPRGFRSSGQAVGRGVRVGADLEYGLWLDVDIAGVVQRFRWIEPGEFSMGSPADEAGRDDDEGPRHRVRLTSGFWLADTACTQGLWEAVTGSNPSVLSDDPRKPVETVSWDDVQEFLRRVEGLLPGVRAELPSEAEWEYACRAGSETAYSWGDEPTPERANYGTGGTVPVKSFAANAWGLYEMHGNVWEWCADGKRTYDEAVVDDPRGPEGADALRVERGGSWLSGAGWLRSASRFRGHRVERYVDLGFRLSLRSTAAERAPGTERLAQGSPPAPEGSAEAAAAAGGEGRRASGADEGGEPGGFGRGSQASAGAFRRPRAKR
ncbi:formylglycine-generating enzyme family protein [Accumulibacter sp.]|uniref:formylglycine-generating enzyme family protein n=1 Tax=Accumulibacter sp. TaxID=2053492 RepID=UPI0025F5F835|nr:formylglycine-generating enzyme family protein [Accumulibacter sp.]MCM8595752.1 formylglycine-generating enzyme family protein [Accumulibacter sp.]MCM8626601.1 formylglycine-generating enzyme family protein [Accumulibacter sp.]MDS4049900.1 formylglycine-generating enzyme family protein [Accumulibacter sp.]